MEVILLLGFLTVLGSLFYLAYHFIRKIKNRDRTLSNKKFYPVLSSGFLLFVIGLAFTDTSDYAASKELEETNTVLLAENNEFQSKIKALETTNKELEERVSEANKEIEDLTLKLTEFDDFEKDLAEQKTKHKEETESFEAIITELESNNTKLTEQEVALTKKVEELEQKNKIATNSNISQAKSGTSSNSTSNSIATSSTPKTQSNNTQATQECNIKGSKSGIYHTPSSSYYSRTTNVVKWFCSEEEARNAGYRAPKR